MSESAIVREVAEQAARRIARKVIGALQKMTDTLSGDDSGLKTAWDEICAQVQQEKSFSWEAYDGTVRRVVQTGIEGLPNYEREAMWLQTDAGIDWNCEDTEDSKQPPMLDADIIDWLTEAHVYSEAANWSNARIRAYLER